MASYSESSSSSEEEAAVDECIDGVDRPDYMIERETGSTAEDSPDGDEVLEEHSDSKPIMARAYQQEMLEASLKQNVIVAVGVPLNLSFDLLACRLTMTDGHWQRQNTSVNFPRLLSNYKLTFSQEQSSESGLSLIELYQNRQVNKPTAFATNTNGLLQRVWMLAPTVALCSQHLEVLKSQIPGVQSKLISGADNVDAWSEQRIWDKVLLNVRIVISTYQILLDALTHAFVRMDSLALIVIDEGEFYLFYFSTHSLTSPQAHNCRGKHPGRRIMNDFYREAQARQQHVPHILGLTASPVVSASMKDLEELETTLNSVCKSPTRHRDELLAHVNRPVMVKVPFTPSSPVVVPERTTTAMSILCQARSSLDIEEDPSILQWKMEDTERSRRKLHDALMSRNTYVQNQMKSFNGRSCKIYEELGPWPAEFYIREAVERFLSANDADEGGISLDPETAYLTGVLQRLKDALPPLLPPKSNEFSHKMHQLFDTLLLYQEDAVGIVFVKDRATTAVLAHVLNMHPTISQRYRVGTMVGTSSIPSVKQGFLDLEQDRLQLHLQNFRTGKTNLLVATSVLEEGIDVPACNLVICFDEPVNLKVFIQRRGRARMKSSRLVLLHEAQSKSLTEWEAREREMKSRYEDEMRELKEIERLEHSETPEYPVLSVEKTGARLTLDDARSHLEHFCATLSSRKYVDWNPDYVTEKVIVGATALLRASVILPISLPEGLRRAESIQAWESEQNAWKDAAFQAYKALFNAGLVNDHLLPLKESDLAKDVEVRPGIILVHEQFNPWLGVSHAWRRENVNLYQRPLRLQDEHGSTLCEFELRLPVPIPDAQPLELYWDHQIQWTLHIGSDQRIANLAQSGLQGIADHTSALLSLAYCHRWEVKDQACVLQFTAHDTTISTEKIANIAFDPQRMGEGLEYLIRDFVNTPYFYRSILPHKPPIDSVQQIYRNFEESPEEIPYLSLGKWPKKTGFFHRPLPPTEGIKSSRPHPRVLPVADARVDAVPLVYAQFGLLIPSIIHYFELYLVATELMSTRLKDLELASIDHVVEAICATSAREPMNYERIEFVGDSILKLCVTVNIAAASESYTQPLSGRS